MNHSHAPGEAISEAAHTHLIEKITVTIDPNTKQLTYALENLDYLTALERLGHLATCIVADIRKPMPAGLITEGQTNESI